MVPASGPLEVVVVTLTAFVGMFGVAVAGEGYVFANVNPILRIVALVGGLMLIVPGGATDIGGVVLVGIVLVLQKMRASKLKNAPHVDLT